MRHGRLVGRRMAIAVVGTFSAVGLVALGYALFSDGLVRADQYSGVLSLLVTCLAAIVSMLMWMNRSRQRSDGDREAAEALLRLRSAVRDQWRSEVSARQLHQPRPLKLRWRPTTSPVQVAPPAKPFLAGWRRGTPWRGTLVADTGDPRPPAATLVDAFEKDARVQLVLLGEPGAGKTTMAILFTLALLANQSADNPVPVLLSVWKPPRGPVWR